MDGASPRTNYHVSTAVYLTRPLSGPDFARLWAGTRLFGKHKTTGAFWPDGTVPRGTHRFELGSSDRVRPLLALGDTPIFGGGLAADAKVLGNPLLDRDFYYAHSPGGRVAGDDTGPQLLYTVSGTWFERAGPEVVLAHLKEHFEVADPYRPRFGLIDLSASEDCYGGTVFGTEFCANSPLHRRAEHVRWGYACSAGQDRARGIYWGNYLGAAILERLGGRGPFLDRFRRQARYEDGRPSARVWEFPNGVFVSLCLDALGTRPGHRLDGWACQNLHWLLLDLGSHGALDPWR